MWLILLAVLSFVGYFLPTICALSNHQHNWASIFVVNLFLGWTLIGWVIALAWAVSRPIRKSEG
jgi:hypothetical protein